MWWLVVLAIAAGLLVVWVVMVALLWWAQRHTADRSRLRDACDWSPTSYGSYGVRRRPRSCALGAGPTVVAARVSGLADRSDP